MSGHSKWSTIKHKKGMKDARRAKLFTKLGRMIAVAARKANTGGLSAKDLYADPVGSLKIAIEKAKKESMPKDNIIRAIERGIGGGEEGALEEFNLEGYGPDGVALLVQCLSDNRNRTIAEIRKIIDKAGGSLGEAGSAAYIFASGVNKPSFTVSLDDATKVEELLEELEDHDDVQDVYTNYQSSQKS